MVEITSEDQNKVKRMRITEAEDRISEVEVRMVEAERKKEKKKN